MISNFSIKSHVLNELTLFSFDVVVDFPFLRHIRDFFHTMFKIDPVRPVDADADLQTGSEKLTLTCVGVGYSNVSKAVL